MTVNIRADSIEIEGYVNAVERRSKPIRSRMGQFIERICKGAFKRAIERNDNIRLLLNHNWDRDLGGTKDGNLELREDNIGLHASAKITDPEVVEKGKRGDLVGWSFGFKDREVDQHVENGMPTRDVRDLDLFEVSLLDRTKNPAYEGTLVSVRSDEDYQYQGEPMLSEIEIRETGSAEPAATDNDSQPEQAAEPEGHKSDIDYSAYESMIAEMKGENP